MPKEKRNLTLEERRAIRDRLHVFREQHYLTRQAMNKAAGVPHSTASAWFDPDPTTPDTVSVVRLAERKNLNLNWLLLGEGTQLRGIEAEAEVWPQLRQTLVAELVSHGASRQDAERLIPPGEKLFDFLMIHLLEGWEKSKRAPLATPRAGIGRAIRRFLSGLDADVGPWPPRRRLL